MYLLGVKYLEALPKITEGSGTTIFLPAEATGVMGAIGAMKELLVRSGASSNQGGAPRPRPSAAQQAPTQPPPQQLGAGTARPDNDADDGPDGASVADL